LDITFLEISAFLPVLSDILPILLEFAKIALTHALAVPEPHQIAQVAKIISSFSQTT
jgi:hypothetical protein